MAVTKYLDSNSFQVGGYTRAYADNWQRIFGKAAEALKADQEGGPNIVVSATTDSAGQEQSSEVRPAEVTYEKP